MRRRSGTVGWAVALALLTAATWWAWLGWDTEYYVDPVTGDTNGPYRSWQVAGCVLCLAVLAVVGGALLPPWVVAPIMTVVFTACWAARAASDDSSGLWVVGAVAVFIGVGVGSTVLSGAVWLVRRRR